MSGQFPIVGNSHSQPPLYIPEEAVRHVSLLLPHGENNICSALESLASAADSGGTVDYIPHMHFSKDDMNHIHGLLCYRIQWVRRLFQNFGKYTMLLILGR
jgi:hypothetical protein